MWALMRPFLAMLVFTIIFGRIAKLPTDGNAPYALMVFAGILPWTLFSTGLSEASNSLINNEKLISKVYFSALDCANSYSRGRVRRFPDQFLHFARADGLVPVFPGLANHCSSGLRTIGLCCEHRSSYLDCIAQRKIPRFPLHHPVYRPIWFVRFTGWFQLKRDTGSMAVAVFTQSNGGCDRWVPMVHSSRAIRRPWRSASL